MYFIDSKNFEEKIQSQDVVLVDIWAPWCGPCKILSPIIDQISLEMGQKVLVGKMNADENMDLCTKLSIRSIPTLLFYKSGKLHERKVGSISKTDIMNILNGMIVETDVEF